MAAIGGVIKVINILIGAAKLAKGVSDVVSKSRPEVGAAVQDKSRWLQCGIENRTEFNIGTTKSYFNSGRYENHPGHVDPFELAVFTACNGDNTVMTGVSAAQAYRITIDQDTDFEFSLGFTNPWSGTYKAGVAAGGNPEDGYNAASQDGGSIRSDLYKAEDEDGKEFEFRITVSATASQKPSFVVTEERWY